MRRILQLKSINKTKQGLFMTTPTDILPAFIQIWNRLTEPLPEIFLGSAILLFAPNEHQWLGWLPIFVAIGFLTQALISHLYKEYSLRTSMYKNIIRASNEERSLLAPMLDCNIDTVHRKDIDNDGLNACLSLVDKGVFIKKENLSSFTLSHTAYQALKKLTKKDKGYFDIKLSNGDGRYIHIKKRK